MNERVAHTSGPWTIEEYGDDNAPALVIHKDSETRVCFMATPGSHGDPARIEADAHLIAAAPDMLAALKELLFHFGNPHRDEWLNNEAFKLAKDADQRARAVIAKAEGRAP